MTTPFLQADIAHDEGCRHVAYRDTLGIWTVGYGHAHVPPGTTWTQERCDEVLAADIADTIAALDRVIPWWRTLNDARQDVLVNMCFNMGWGNGKHGLSSFKTTLGQIEGGNYEVAANRMLESHWAEQVHGRAKRLSEQMRTGVRIAPEAA